jgi:hypothetical protein
VLQLNIGIVGVIIGICLSFGGFYLANRLTNFGSTPSWLAIVAVVSVTTNMIPKCGWIISLVATFLLLKSVSKNGVFLMMIVSWIMMIVIILILSKLIHGI